MHLIRSILLLSCLALAAPCVSNAQSSTTPAASPREYRVLLAGNSLITTNNLPAMLRAVAASQGTIINTETYAAPNGTLAQRWHDGHVQDALRNRTFDVVVLQEMGGKLAACLASAEQRKAPCAASQHAYSGMSGLAAKGGAKTLVFTTWGPDDRWQGRLDRSARMSAVNASATVFNAAGMLRALAKTDPEAKLFPDGSHPSPRASLMLALALYREITGATPVARELRITAPLLPTNAAVSPDSAMETQSAVAGAGNVTVIPASLVEPLVAALPAPGSAEMNPSRRGR